MSITLRLSAKELDELETILLRESYDNFNDDITDSDELMQLNMKVSDAIADLKESSHEILDLDKSSHEILDLYNSMRSDLVRLQTPLGIDHADYYCSSCGRHVRAGNQYICLDCQLESISHA